MGEDRACRYEPEAARELEQRENRGGGGGGTSVLVRQQKAVSNVVGATSFSTPSIGLSNPTLSPPRRTLGQSAHKYDGESRGKSV